MAVVAAARQWQNPTILAGSECTAYCKLLRERMASGRCMQSASAALAAIHDWFERDLGQQFGYLADCVSWLGAEQSKAYLNVALAEDEETSASRSRRSYANDLNLAFEQFRRAIELQKNILANALLCTFCGNEVYEEDGLEDENAGPCSGCTCATPNQTAHAPALD